VTPSPSVRQSSVQSWKHGEVAVGGRVDVELDDIGARVECGPHRRQGVLEERMLRWMNPRRGAAVALDAGRIIGLRQAAMGQQRRTGRPLEYQPGGVVEKDERREQDDARGGVFQCFLHALPEAGSVGWQSGNNAAAPRRRYFFRNT
jgi:hypothetical protein